MSRRQWQTGLVKTLAMSMALLSASFVFAQAETTAKPDLVAPSVSQVMAANSPFSKAIELRGTLGRDKVQMHLQPKVDDIDSVEGNYFLLGKGKKKILLAGEVGSNALSMEESEDGIDVSGQWDGKLDGKVLRGTWTSDDGKVAKDFVLELQTPGPSSGKSAHVASKTAH